MEGPGFITNAAGKTKNKTVDMSNNIAGRGDCSLPVILVVVEVIFFSSFAMTPDWLEH